MHRLARAHVSYSTWTATSEVLISDLTAISTLPEQASSPTQEPCGPDNLARTRKLVVYSDLNNSLQACQPPVRGLGAGKAEAAHSSGAEDVTVGKVLGAQVSDGQPRQHDLGSRGCALVQLLVDDVPLRIDN